MQDDPVPRKASSLARSVARLVALCILAAFYAIGVVAGVLTVAVVALAAAVRLGWADARKRGGHGPA